MRYQVNLQKVESLLLESLDSGESREMTSHDWLEIRQKVKEKLIALTEKN